MKYNNANTVNDIFKDIYEHTIDNYKKIIQKQNKIIKIMHSENKQLKILVAFTSNYGKIENCSIQFPKYYIFREYYRKLLNIDTPYPTNIKVEILYNDYYGNNCNIGRFTVSKYNTRQKYSVSNIIKLKNDEYPVYLQVNDIPNQIIIRQIPNNNNL